MEAILTARQLHKLERQILVQKRNEPPRLSVGEEVFNAASHALGLGLAIAGFVLLLLRSDNGWKIAASCFYGISMVVMMFASSLYHGLPAGSVAKRVLRRFDYLSIYLLIGGTFAPVWLVYLGGTTGVVLLCVQWGIILLGGTLVMAFGPGRWRSLHFTLFFLLGWSGLMFVPEFYRHARNLLWFIFWGGMVYTVGMIPFARRHKYDHCVWHLFVIAAALLQWIGIYTQIY